MRVAAALAILAVIAPRAVAASPSENPQLALEQGRVAYERGNYNEAVDVIHPLLYPSIELRSEESVVEAHRLLALSYFFMTKTGQAEEEASSLLALRPNYELDPIVDPPAAVSFFETVKKRQDERLREIRERQREEDERARKEKERKEKEAHAKAERVYVARVVENRTRAIGFIPFGVGQFYNGHVGSGVAFAVTEFLLGACWASTTLAIDQLWPKHQITSADVDKANALLGVQVASGAAFWGVVITGIIEAQVRFRPERVIQERELPPAKAKLKATLAPIISPGFFGLGVQGSF
jgi:hypothetical protein